MKYEKGEKVNIINGRYKGCRGIIYDRDGDMYYMCIDNGNDSMWWVYEGSMEPIGPKQMELFE